jgi:hypothetical protein
MIAEIQAKENEEERLEKIKAKEARRKKKKKKRPPALPDRCVVIKNLDKDVGNWMENWSKPKRRSPGHIPHSFRLLSLGGVGKGKTNYMKQLFLKHQSSAKPFKKLYIITCDMTSLEWDDCEPDEVFDHMPDISLFDPSEKTCVIIDDFEFEKCGSEQLRNLTTLFRMISSHKNVSVMASYQSFFHCPSICRKTANVFILYKPTSKQELHNIANRVGIPHEDLKQMFKLYCHEHYDMIMLDGTKDSPYKIRKNIYDIIEYNPDSDSD